MRGLRRKSHDYLQYSCRMLQWTAITAATNPTTSASGAPFSATYSSNLDPTSSISTSAAAQRSSVRAT